MPNRLAQQHSPYLLQHAGNPVDWYPWGPEALQRARAENKPIFLSIGYSACHWCHVMAHESFENPGVAEILNRDFVNVKVDREERPELDQLYMEAVQVITGQGGWPLSVFLTPEREPFFGGTYWPTPGRGGMPGFDQVLRAVSDVWQTRPEQARDQARRITHILQADPEPEGPPPVPGLSNAPLAAAEAWCRRTFDTVYGGFGPAPKFPQALLLRVLLRRWKRTGDPDLLNIVATTLDRMAAGGIYDHLGGGFHRYSVDGQWLVPHFEKMLYDNALLAQCYLEAWQATGREAYADVVRETLDYVLRDMTDPAGGFHSAEDADSEGQEGRFYVWTPDQVAAVLDAPRARRFAAFYDVSPAGNFEGRNILNRGKSLAQAAKMLDYPAEPLAAELAEDRARLREVRARRVRPGRDDKVLVSWNGLMIEALARAGAALAEPRYVQAAARAAEFLLREVRDPAGRLRRYGRGGQAQGQAYLDDLAALANGLVGLYEAQFDERWVDEALRLADEILARFADARQGGFFYTPHDHEPLPARKKDLFDSAVPSATGLAVTALLRLGKLCQRSDYLAAADRALQACLPLMERAPAALGQMLLALDFSLGPVPEIVILAGANGAATAVLDAIARRFLPNRVLAFRHEVTREPPPAEARGVLSPVFEGKHVSAAGPTLYVCQDFACQTPVTGREAVLAALDKLAPQ